MAAFRSQLQLDIDDVKARTGITDAQLDGRIKEDKLWELAGLLGSYELYVGRPGFGLNEADIADLRDLVSKNGHQYTMKKALKKWFNVTPADATYRSLLTILINLDKRTTAEKMCEMVTGRVASHETVTSEMRSNQTVANGAGPSTKTLPADILTISQKDEILEKLVEAKNEWYYIGKGIGISDANLKEIEDRYHPNTLRCLDEILKRRIQRGGLTRSVLRQSLCGIHVERDDVAQMI